MDGINVTTDHDTVTISVSSMANVNVTMSQPEAIKFATVILDAAGISIEELIRMVRDHKDYAGGTIFTRTDVAHALFDTNGDVCAPPDDAVSRVTEEHMRMSQNILEDYMMGHAYTWVHALRDNLLDPDELEDDEYA